MDLNPRHLTLSTLFAGRLFRIPEYQRAYAWETPQRADLFRDIRDARAQQQEHFMATVVSQARERRRIGADEFQAVDIVDGQQRLTTLVVLFKAIEKALDAEQPIQAKVKREIGELLVKGDEHSLVLLQTNHEGSTVFTRYMRDGAAGVVDGSTAAEQNLINAIDECERFVGQWAQNDDLIELVALLRNRFSLIYHELADESIVYRVFEVLNSRGLDVKWIDKLKSQLMALIFEHTEHDHRPELLREMQTIWQAIYRRLGLRTDLGDEALRFAGTWRLAERRNRLCSEEDAARSLMVSAGTQIKTIYDTARFLQSVVEAVHELDANVRLRAVTQVAHVRFLAVAIVLRHFDDETKTRLLTEWEKVSFRVFGIYGADSRHKVGEYLRLGYDVMAKNIPAEEILASITHLGCDYPIDRVLKEVDWSESYDSWQEQLRYLLYRYDEYLAKKAKQHLDTVEWKKIWAAEPSRSIEHIQPRSSGMRYVNHLGNLTMLPPRVNSALKDSSPLDKSGTYAYAGLRGTADVGRLIQQERGWNERMVKARAAEIEQFIREEWG